MGTLLSRTLIHYSVVFPADCEAGAFSKARMWMEAVRLPKIGRRFSSSFGNEDLIPILMSWQASAIFRVHPSPFLSAFLSSTVFHGLRDWEDKRRVRINPRRATRTWRGVVQCLFCTPVFSLRHHHGQLPLRYFGHWPCISA